MPSECNNGDTAPAARSRVRLTDRTAPHTIQGGRLCWYFDPTNRVLHLHVLSVVEATGRTWAELFELSDHGGHLLARSMSRDLKQWLILGARTDEVRMAAFQSRILPIFSGFISRNRGANQPPNRGLIGLFLEVSFLMGYAKLIKLGQLR